MISNSNKTQPFFVCLQKNKTFLSGMTPISSSLKQNFYWNPWVKRLNLSKGILGREAEACGRIGKTDFHEKKKIKNF